MYMHVWCGEECGEVCATPSRCMYRLIILYRKCNSFRCQFCLRLIKVDPINAIGDRWKCNIQTHEPALVSALHTAKLV